MNPDSDNSSLFSLGPMRKWQAQNTIMACIGLVLSHSTDAEYYTELSGSLGNNS